MVACVSFWLYVVVENHMLLTKNSHISRPATALDLPGLSRGKRSRMILTRLPLAAEPSVES